MSQYDLVFSRINQERNQGHDTRKRLFYKIEELLNRPLLSYFTSFEHPVSIDDRDVNTIEAILQSMDLSNGLALMISSPGGDGMAAERIVKACRAYSGTNEYWAIVPSMAKSAGTMVCFGASKIMMSPTSELGPVDPQIITEGDKGRQVFPAYTILETYKELFNGAINATGNVEPYLQQLRRFDSRRVKMIESAIALSSDISVKTLAAKGGMMEGTSHDDIEKHIEVFINPDHTKNHGRPIYLDECVKCGLNVEEFDPKSELWGYIYELYLRTDNYVSMTVAKCIENNQHSFGVTLSH